MVGKCKLVAVWSHLIWKNQFWKLVISCWVVSLRFVKTQGPRRFPPWDTGYLSYLCEIYTPEIKVCQPYLRIPKKNQEMERQQRVKSKKHLRPLIFETKIVGVVVFCKLRSQLGRNWACFLSTVCAQNSQLLKNKWGDYSLGEHVPIRASFKRSCLSKSRQSDTRQFTTYLAWNHDVFIFFRARIRFSQETKELWSKRRSRCLPQRHQKGEQETQNLPLYMKEWTTLYVWKTCIIWIFDMRIYGVPQLCNMYTSLSTGMSR